MVGGDVGGLPQPRFSFVWVTYYSSSLCPRSIFTAARICCCVIKASARYPMQTALKGKKKKQQKTHERSAALPSELSAPAGGQGWSSHRPCGDREAGGGTRCRLPSPSGSPGRSAARSPAVPAAEQQPGSGAGPELGGTRRLLGAVVRAPPPPPARPGPALRAPHGPAAGA